MNCTETPGAKLLAADGWQRPTVPPVLEPGTIHVWRASLAQPDEVVGGLAPSLTDDECARAERFRFEYLRRRFVVGRGILRSLLAHYLSVAPADILFGYGHRGKPRLAHVLPGLHFNMAHADDLALYAVSRDRELGVDVEPIRHLPDAQEVARQFFSAHEIAQLQSVSAAWWDTAFFCCWTRKEAYIKARGEGLFLPLDQFDVSVDPAAPARLIASRIAPDDVARWRLVALWPAPGYVGALAVEGQNEQLVTQEWDSSLLIDCP